jgi:nucleoside-diphosphate-sugar epimerase
LNCEGYTHIQADLSDKAGLIDIYKRYPITHTIHLATLAHTKGVADLSKFAYRQANVINAQNVFEAAKSTKILFISTVDVYGFTKGTVSGETEVHPVSIYGKTKAEAEKILKKQGGKFNIYRCIFRCGGAAVPENWKPPVRNWKPRSINRAVSEVVMWLPWLTKKFARGSMSRLAARPTQRGCLYMERANCYPIWAQPHQTEWWISSGFC